MDLNDLRQRIDQIDSKLVQLLNDRATIALSIGHVKRQQQSPELADGEQLHVYAPGREKLVFDKVTRMNRGPLSNEALGSIYREVISASISLQKDLCIGYLGPPGTFSHQVIR